MGSNDVLGLVSQFVGFCKRENGGEDQYLYIFLLATPSRFDMRPYHLKSARFIIFQTEKWKRKKWDILFLLFDRKTWLE